MIALESRLNNPNLRLDYITLVPLTYARCCCCYRFCCSDKSAGGAKQENFGISLICDCGKANEGNEHFTYTAPL